MSKSYCNPPLKGSFKLQKEIFNKGGLSMRNFVFLSLLAIFIALYGCNLAEDTGLSDTSSKEACEYKVNSALDDKDYDKVIELLKEGGECADVLNDTDKNIDLAAAYVGKAGFDIPSLVNDILASNETLSSNDTFGNFAEVISKRAKGEALTDLDIASTYYQKAVGQNIDCANETETENLSIEKKNACFLYGLVQTAQAGVSMSMLFESFSISEEPIDISDSINYWIEGGNKTTCDEMDINNNGVPDTADFSVCALDYAIDKALDRNSPCDNSTIKIEHYPSYCTFGYTGKKYYIVEFTINPDYTVCSNLTTPIREKRVIEDTGNGSLVVLTDGWCNCDNGSVCDPSDNNCYPCPVVLGKEEGTNETASVVGMIIDTLNEGSDAVINLVGTITTEEGEIEETDLEEQINDFKRDFCESNPQNCACYVDGTWSQCTNATLQSAEDVKLGTYNASTGEVIADENTQQLIVDYLLNQ